MRVAKCGSWPHCDRKPIQGDKFCAEHRAILDRVKSTPKATTSPKVSKKVPAPVTVSQIPGKRETLEKEIIETLTKAAEGMSTMALREALSVKRENRTFNRAQYSLLSAGRIVRTGIGRAARFTLAQD